MPNAIEKPTMSVTEGLIKYSSEIKTVPLGTDGKTITVENLTPILSLKEREQRKKDIEKRLFYVFIKYANIKNE